MPRNISKSKTKIVIDANVWVSFAIGKSMLYLRDIATHKAIEVIANLNLIEEVSFALQKPKVLKYISPDRARIALELMIETCKILENKQSYSLSRDPKDDYLIDLAIANNAHFLITGDKDLLTLKEVAKVKIITLKDFHNIFLKELSTF